MACPPLPLEMRILIQPRRLAWNAPQDAAGAETVRSCFNGSQQEVLREA